MVKVTKKQIADLDKLLDSPANLQKLGAALVHTMKQQLKPDVEINSIELILVDKPLFDWTEFIQNSIDVSANSIVSVGWSADISAQKQAEINTRIGNLAPKERAKIIKTLVPKGLENGQRRKLIK